MLRFVFALMLVAAAAIVGLLFSKSVGTTVDAEFRVAGCINGRCS